MEREIIKIGILSEFWEKQNKDIIDIVLPMIKCAISENYDNKGKFHVVNKDATLNYLKNNYNKNFTMSLLDNAMKRLVNYNILINKDDSYCVNNEDSIKKSKKEEKEANDKISELWSKIVDDLKLFVKENDYFPFFTNISIENKLWDFLNTDINIVEDIDINEDANKRIIGRYLIKKKIDNDYIYSSIKKIVLSVFISKSINLYNERDSQYWAQKRVFVDTRFLMNILDMNNIDENNSSKELLEILKKNAKDICTFSHNVEEINKVIDAYIYQKQQGFYVKTNIDLFDRDNYSDSQIAIFRKSIEDKLKNIGISIIVSKVYSEVDKKYIDEFEENYIEKNNISKQYDLHNYCNTIIQYTSSKDTLFISIGKTLPILFSKTHKYHNDFVFISESDFASLYFINSSSECSEFNISKVLSSAYLLQEPTEEYFNSLISNLQVLAKNGEISEETKMLYVHEKNIQRELMVETGYSSSNISKDKILYVREKYIKNIEKPLVDKILEREKEFKEKTLASKNENNELKAKLNVSYEENNKLKESIDIKSEKIKQLESENIELTSYKELYLNEKKKTENKQQKKAKIYSFIIIILIIIMLLFIVLAVMLEPCEIIKKLKQNIIVRVLLYMVSIFASGLIIYILLVLKKLRRRIEEFIIRKMML